MFKDPKAAIMIIAVVSLISFSIACACGSLHIAEDLSEQIIPTSITSSDDQIKPIKENNFTPAKVSITQPTTKKNTTKNYTKNNTNDTSSNNTNIGSSQTNGTNHSSKYNNKYRSSSDSSNY